MKLGPSAEIHHVRCQFTQEAILLNQSRAHEARPKCEIKHATREKEGASERTFVVRKKASENITGKKGT